MAITSQAPNRTDDKIIFNRDNPKPIFSGSENNTVPSGPGVTSDLPLIPGSLPLPSGNAPLNSSGSVKFTEASVAAEEKKVFEPLTKNGIEVITPKDLSLEERHQIAYSYSGKPSQAELKKLGDLAKKYEEKTGKEVQFATGKMPADRVAGSYQTNSLFSEGEKNSFGMVIPENTIQLQVKFNTNDMKTAREQLSAEGKTSEYGGIVASQPTNQNELSEIGIRFKAMLDIFEQTAEDPNFKSKRDIQGVSQVVEFASSNLNVHPSVQLSTQAIDSSRDRIHDIKYGFTADSLKRNDETSQVLKTLSPTQLVLELNNALRENDLSNYGLLATEEAPQFNLDKNGFIDIKTPITPSKKPVSVVPLDRLTVNAKPFIEQTENNKPTFAIPGVILAANNVAYPNHAAQIRNEFVSERLKEAFPGQYEKIGFRFEMYDLKDSDGKPVLGEDKKPVQAEKPVFFVKQ